MFILDFPLWNDMKPQTRLVYKIEEAVASVARIDHPNTQIYIE